MYAEYKSRCISLGQRSRIWSPRMAYGQRRTGIHVYMKHPINSLPYSNYFLFRSFSECAGFCLFTKAPSHILKVLWKYFHPVQEVALHFVWANPGSYQLPLRWPLVLYRETSSSWSLPTFSPPLLALQTSAINQVVSVPGWSTLH